MQSENALRAGAVACFKNAQELYEEAKLLSEQARFPRSVALALIGAEEFAKSVVFPVAALLPEQRGHLPSRVDGHELKRQICGLADAALIENSDWWAEAEQFGGSTVFDRLSDLFGVLAELGLDGILDKKGARQYYEKRRREDAEWSRCMRHLQENPDRDIYLSFREPDLKNAALYVDMDASGRILSPTNRVEEHDADMRIAGLEYFLGN